MYGIRSIVIMEALIDGLSAFNVHLGYGVTYTEAKESNAHA